jgi:hypothetical protein
MMAKFHYNSFLDEILDETDDPVLIRKIFSTVWDKEFGSASFCFAKFECLNKTSFPNEELGYLMSKLGKMTFNIDKLALLSDQASKLRSKITDYQPLNSNEINFVSGDFRDISQKIQNYTRTIDLWVSSITNSLIKHKGLSGYRYSDTLLHRKGQKELFERLPVPNDIEDISYPGFLLAAGINQFFFIAIEKGSKFSNSCQVAFGKRYGGLVGRGYEQIWRKKDGEWEVVFQQLAWLS